MKTVQLDLLFTILAAMVVLFAAARSIARSAFLKRFSIPAPVVGGVLVAILLALVDGLGGVRVSFEMSLRDNLLLMFFTTVGLSADARMLARGGPKLAIFLLVSAVFIVVQNIVGIAAAMAMDLHPIVGLLGGSITLTGGHGTGAAYGARLGDTMNIAGTMELTMACATAGLVLGSVLGGPLAEYLVRRHGLSPARRQRRPISSAAPKKTPIPSRRSRCSTRCSRSSSRLPPARYSPAWFWGPESSCRTFSSACCSESLIRNLATFVPRLSVSNATVDLLGGVSLSLFLVMALMGMRLIDLASLAGPLLVILALQTVAMALYAVFVTFRVMGRDYDAAVLAAGHVGFALSSTAAALAIMKTITERKGPSPLAFVIVPMVGAFFIDIANALVIQGYLALPIFGFRL